MMSMFSRSRVSGWANATPCRPSITRGPEVPNPSTNRPCDKFDRVIAAWAIATGVRVPI